MLLATQILGKCSKNGCYAPVVTFLSICGGSILRVDHRTSLVSPSQSWIGRAPTSFVSEIRSCSWVRAQALLRLLGSTTFSHIGWGGITARSFSVDQWILMAPHKADGARYALRLVSA